jgi:uroporphyrinogen-III synthase
MVFFSPSGVQAVMKHIRSAARLATLSPDTSADPLPPADDEAVWAPAEVRAAALAGLRGACIAIGATTAAALEAAQLELEALREAGDGQNGQAEGAALEELRLSPVRVCATPDAVGLWGALSSLEVEPAEGINK